MNTNVVKMSTAEVVTETVNIPTEINLEGFSTLSTTWLNESEVTSTVGELGEEFSTIESVNNASMSDKQRFLRESQVTLSVLQAFIIIEIVMTALELILSVLAATKVTRWRRNYRNQMLMQLSVVRFIKRVIALTEFCKDNSTIPNSSQLTLFLVSAQIYIDFVIVILVFFFIKHMYDTLIVVLVKISQNSLVKVLICSWLIPLPISAIGAVIVGTETLTHWTVYLFICAFFRWPLIFIGTALYITILCKVLHEKIRKFARSLTIITFLLCLVINFYLFSKDVIWLWCIHNFSTILASYFLGFLLNVLILCLYVILIILDVQCKTKSCTSMPDPDVAVVKY